MNHAIKEAMRDGGAPLGRGRLNLVGQGRAGKTALARALRNLDFEETKSTAGVEHQLMEVTRAALGVCGDGSEWQPAKGCCDHGAISAEQAAAATVAKKVVSRANSRPSQNDESIPITKLLSPASENLKGSFSRAAESMQSSDSKKKQKSGLDHLMDRELILKLARDEAAKESVELRLSLWDFGGQSVFYALHHLYLTRFAAFAVLFNMKVWEAILCVCFISLFDSQRIK